MLQCEKIDIHEGIDFDKSIECMICHYWYFKDIGFKCQPYVFNKCHDLSMVVYDLKDVMIFLKKVLIIDVECLA